MKYIIFPEMHCLCGKGLLIVKHWKYIKERNVIHVLNTDLLVIATDLLDLAGERLYSALGNAVLVKRHLQLPLDFVVMGLDLGELPTIM